jgi:ATP adenylyltransferase
MLSGSNPHHIIYQDKSAVAFLNKYPPLYGYVLVAPCEHKEHVTSDFTKDEYISLQNLIYEVSEAIKKVVSTERMYMLSLGSQQGNSHVHWHIAPLPPGVPYEKQQFHALRMRNGILEIPDTELAQLARSIRDRMEI